mmetsp:Transcript_7706/g.20449  ORF Transcript_7706/g.20449 Transcript_7706/m.20449 type:complete len:260 (-) Transcript_7706:3253-4032(-)
MLDGRPGEQGRGAAGREENEGLHHRESAMEEGRREGGLDRASAGCGDRARSKGRHFKPALRKTARRRPLWRCRGAGLFGHNCRETRTAPARHARVGLRSGHALADGSGSCEAVLVGRRRRHGQERRRGRVAGANARQTKRGRVALLQAHRAGPVGASGAVAVSGGHALRDGGGFRGRAEEERRRRDRQGRRALRGFTSKAVAKRRGAARCGRRPRINHRCARRAATGRAATSVIAARDRAQDVATVDETCRDEPRRGSD